MPSRKAPAKKSSGSSFLYAQGFVDKNGNPIKPAIRVEVTKPKACYLCGSDDFWINNAGEFVCYVCHPNYREGHPIEENSVALARFRDEFVASSEQIST